MAKWLLLQALIFALTQAFAASNTPPPTEPPRLNLGHDRAKVANPDALPPDLRYDYKIRELQNQVKDLAAKLQATQQELRAQREAFERHGHNYTAPGNVTGLSLDSVAEKGSLYYGKGFVVLGGKGTPGNVGILYRTTARTSGPVQ